MSHHLADVTKYARKPVNEAALAGLAETCRLAKTSRPAKTYRLAMSKPDTKYVACSDKAELETVRRNFLEKKFGLSGDDLDASITSVCETMRASRSKSRLTFYHLLAEHCEKLGTFG